MATDDDLGAWLADIGEKDAFLASSSRNVPAVPTTSSAPIRGNSVQEVPKKVKPKKKDTSVPKPMPKDDAAIWEEDEVAAPGSQGPAAPVPAGAAGGAPPPKKTEEVKPRQRKHAYEYFNQWDRYDVEGECAKLEDPADANDANDAAEDAAPANDGLPPDLTAAALAKMPAVEVSERTAPCPLETPPPPPLLHPHPTAPPASAPPSADRAARAQREE